MIYWVDAQLPPQLAKWLSDTFKVEAYALRDLNLRDAEDAEIFEKARQDGIVIISNCLEGNYYNDRKTSGDILVKRIKNSIE
jgi:predicted nuclease of predicted toxin-antitoxin system